MILGDNTKHFRDFVFTTKRETLFLSTTVMPHHEVPLIAAKYVP